MAVPGQLHSEKLRVRRVDIELLYDLKLYFSLIQNQSENYLKKIK